MSESKSNEGPEISSEQAGEIAGVLRKAMKGLGTDEDAVIAALAPLKTRATQQVVESYAATIERNLYEDIESEFRGDCEKVLLELLKTPARSDADQIHKAMKGLGTNESLLIEIIGTRSDEEIKAAADEFRATYEKNMRDAIAGETGGKLKAALLQVIDAALGQGRQTPPDEEIEEYAKRLYAAGEDKMGVNSSVFFDIICNNSREYVEKISAYYARNFKGNALRRVIKSEFSGDVEDLLVALVTPNDEYFTEVLHKATIGNRTGTDEDALTRIIARQRNDLKPITDYFLRKHDKDITAVLRSEVGGDFKNALIAIVKAHG